MSIRIMSHVWAGGPVDPVQKLVLLAIADHADDDGIAYPSMVGIAAKCSLTERGARGIVRRLEAGGWLDTRVGGGRGGKSVYQVLPPETRNNKPGITNPEYEETRNVTTLNPERDDTKPGTSVPPNHHITIIEPSEDTPLGFPAPVKAAERPPPKARLPSDWVLSDDGWAYARSLQIPDRVISDEASGFHAYWTDRRDRDASKSANGWEQCWRNRCRAIAGRYAGRGMAGQTGTSRYGPGGGIAGAVARRRLATPH